MKRILKVSVKSDDPNFSEIMDFIGQFPEKEFLDPSNPYEVAFYCITSSPTFIITEGSNTFVQSWRGSIPEPEDIWKYLLEDK